LGFQSRIPWCLVCVSGRNSSALNYLYGLRTAFPYNDNDIDSVGFLPVTMQPPPIRQICPHCVPSCRSGSGNEVAGVARKRPAFCHQCFVLWGLYMDGILTAGGSFPRGLNIRTYTGQASDSLRQNEGREDRFSVTAAVALRSKRARDPRNTVAQVVDARKVW